MRILFVLLILALPATAAAKPVPVKGSGARLLECSTDKRSAKFQGEMERVPRATQLQMRFSLETRTASAPDWSRVAGVWGERITRATSFVYDREITGLVAGDYRAVVRFLWRSTKGKILARALKRTRACRQPDARANLEPERVWVSSGSTDETRFYSVRVVNTGQSAAPPFSTRIEVAGTVPPEEATGEPLPPGEQELFEFEAPPCSGGSTVTVTVDTGAAVDEVDEADNVLSLPCPLRRGTT